MKEIVIISGKGGTGKTSIVAAFAALAENKVLCDADVDAAGNLNWDTAEALAGECRRKLWRLNHPLSCDRKAARHCTRKPR